MDIMTSLGCCSGILPHYKADLSFYSLAQLLKNYVTISVNQLFLKNVEISQLTDPKLVIIRMGSRTLSLFRSRNKLTKSFF